MLNTTLSIPCCEETAESTIAGAAYINHLHYQCMVFLLYNGSCYIFLKLSVIQKEYSSGYDFLLFRNRSSGQGIRNEDH